MYNSRIEFDDSYQILGQLSRTEISTVYLIRRGDNFFVLKVAHSPSREKIRIMLEEANAYMKMKDLGDIKLIDSATDKDSLFKKEYPWLILDYVPGVTLHDFLETARGKQADPERVLIPDFKYKLIYQIAFNLNNIHKSGAVHRDIKPSNIFMDPFFHPHIGDFGEMTDTSKKYTVRVHGTPNFIPPEGFADLYGDEISAIPISTKFDVFSFGGTLLQILTYEYPHSDIQYDSNDIIMDEIKSRLRENPIDMRFEPGHELESQLVPEDYPLYDLYKQCCAANPEDRPTMEQVLDRIIECARITLKDQFNKFYKWTQSLKVKNEEGDDIDDDDEHSLNYEEDDVEEEEDFNDQIFFGSKDNIILALKRGFHHLNNARALSIAAKSLGIDLDSYKDSLVNQISENTEDANRKPCDTFRHTPHNSLCPELSESDYYYTET